MAATRLDEGWAEVLDRAGKKRVIRRYLLDAQLVESHRARLTTKSRPIEDPVSSRPPQVYPGEPDKNTRSI